MLWGNHLLPILHIYVSDRAEPMLGPLTSQVTGLWPQWTQGLSPLRSREAQPAFSGFLAQRLLSAGCEGEWV